jgi:LmbE family N-acetylglucosaminyl deacetylase
MHIEQTPKNKQPVSIFFFAHQDDEFGVFQRISLECQLGHRVICAYLTSGVQGDQSSCIRNNESLGVLEKLGVAREDVIFAGNEVNISDGELLLQLDLAISWVEGLICRVDSIGSLYIPAWEGGHPDHDVLHATVLIAVLNLEVELQVRQFSLYNAYKCPSPLFRVLRPLPNNGNAMNIIIPWRNRFQFLKYCLSYPSQLKSWVGLFPFTLIHYFFLGVESVQDVSLSRLIERPHDGPLYYERRKFCKWCEVQSSINECLKRKSIILP